MSEYFNDIRQALEAQLPWDKLEGKSILVTGATGLIGSCLVEMLLSKEDLACNVYAAGRNEQRARQKFSRLADDQRFHFLRFDVTSPLEGDTTFHYIIHAASGASPILYSTDPVGVMKGNIQGVDNLLSYGREHGMERFLYVSSGEIYGEGDGRVFDEQYSGYVDSMSSRSCYPSSKRAAETLCAAYACQYGIDFVVARPCHVYGPGFTESDHRVYAEFIRNVIHNEDIVMKSTGAQYRSWCYDVDCASALLHILLKGESGNAYNVADEASNITIRELATLIAEIGGREVRIELPSDIEKRGFNPVTKSLFSNQKLCALGWHPLHDMHTDMLHTIERVKEINDARER